MRCGYERGHLEPSINDAAAHAAIDEGRRDNGLRALRELNFARLLDRIAPRLPGPRVLEVGAAHGWFVRQARRRGLDAHGIEPDEAVRALARRDGVELRGGFFPAALQAHERFDAIVFNDTFEHIPDARGTLRECALRLGEGGLLVVNLPSSRGIFYRVAKAARRFGVGGFFDRLWQKDLPSPHVHYFHAGNLARCAKLQGFEPVGCFHLPTVRLAGLYDRIAFVRTRQRWAAPAVWSAVVMAWPLLTLLPDIDVVTFRRAGGPPVAG
jgi:SAM-dependent methyltransferase